MNERLFESYAMTCRMSPSELRQHDAMRYSNNPDEGFEIWRRCREQEYRDRNPGAFCGERLTDEEGFHRHCVGFALLVSATWGHA